MKPIEMVILLLSCVAGVIVLVMVITLFRKAERENAAKRAESENRK
jgi:hypothetical protein